MSGNYFSDSSPGDVYRGASKEPEALAHKANRSFSRQVESEVRLFLDLIRSLDSLLFVCRIEESSRLVEKNSLFFFL